MIATSAWALWQEAAWRLGIGGTAAVLLAWLWSKVWRAAADQRTVWQLSTAALAGLVVAELTGTGPWIIFTIQHRGPRTASATSNAATAAPPAGPVKDSDLSPIGFTVPPAGEAGSDEPVDGGALAERPVVRTNESAAIVSLLTAAAGAEHGSPAPRSTFPHDEAPMAAPPAPRVLWPGVVWLIGTLLLGCRLLLTHLLLTVLAWKRRQPIDPILPAQIATLGATLGWRRQPRVIACRGLDSPLAYGILRPTIAVPVDFTSRFRPQEQTVILAHELGHLAAGDPCWWLLAELVAAALWWHPVAWWSRRRLHLASEWAADEASTTVEDGPLLLARCLVDLGKRLVPTAAAGWPRMAGDGFRSSLGRRVVRLMALPAGAAPGRPRRATTRILGLAVLVATAGLPVTWARPIPTEGETTMRTIRDSWRQSLAGVMLASALSPAPVALAAPAVIGPQDGGATAPAVGGGGTIVTGGTANAVQTPANPPTQSRAQLTAEVARLRQQLQALEQELATIKAQQKSAGAASFAPFRNAPASGGMMGPGFGQGTGAGFGGGASTFGRSRSHGAAAAAAAAPGSPTLPGGGDLGGGIGMAGAGAPSASMGAGVGTPGPAVGGAPAAGGVPGQGAGMAMGGGMGRGMMGGMPAPGGMFPGAPGQAMGGGMEGMMGMGGMGMPGTAPSTQKPLFLRVFQLKHRTPDEVRRLLIELGAANGRAHNVAVAALPNSNALFVRGTEEDLAKVGQMIVAVDVPAEQLSSIPGTSVHTIVLKSVSAEEVLQILNGLGFGRRNPFGSTRGLVQISSFNKNRNLMIMGASPAEIKEIETVVQTLEKQSTSRPDSTNAQPENVPGTTRNRQSTTTRSTTRSNGGGPL